MNERSATNLTKHKHTDVCSYHNYKIHVKTLKTNYGSIREVQELDKMEKLQLNTTTNYDKTGLNLNFVYTFTDWEV